MSAKNVSFSEITIQEYPIELGDHPSCSSGAPIQIGWEPQAVFKRNLDLYEYMREGERRHGRKQLSIPVKRRSKLLIESGYSLDEIVDATLKVETAKELRAETLKLDTNGKLPKDILTGFAKLVIKPVRKTVQARSA